MPDTPQIKTHPHPWQALKAARAAGLSPGLAAASPEVAYAELAVTSNFTFLTGASHPDELAGQAAALGYHALALTDTHTLAGVVRAHVAAKDAAIPLVVGCRLLLQNDAAPSAIEVLVYPTSLDSYARLCTMLTRGKRRTQKGCCELTLHDLLEFQQDLLAIWVPPPPPGFPGPDETWLEVAAGLRRTFDDDRFSIAAARSFGDNDEARLGQIDALCRHLDVPMVATNDVHYHDPSRRPLHDVVTCIRHGCRISDAGMKLMPHAERHLKPPAEMARLFAGYPHAIARTAQIASRAVAGFQLDQLRYEYPHEICPPGVSPMQHLASLTWRGAAERYPAPPGTAPAPAPGSTPGPAPGLAGLPGKVRAQIEHELQLIDELHYAPYFLTVYDLVIHARKLGILCQGRGAAANSAVCYCLGVTAVDPDRIDVLFERFVSKQRNEPPDIDIDFEHERREEVIQYIYGKYGRDRAALCAEVISYRARSAVRDVGKALGLSLDAVDRLAKNLDWWDHGQVREPFLRELGLDPADPTIRQLTELVHQILGFPRHLSQHVGGFVITRQPLCHMVPIENAAMPDRTVIEWDKDDVDAMGMLKIDVLGLGMLTCVRKALEMVNGQERHEGTEARRHEGAKTEASQRASHFQTSRPPLRASPLPPAPPSPAPPLRAFVPPCLRASPLQFHTVPPEDPRVYNAICQADTVGVFQIESRAQMSMLPRLRPRCFYDLVIEVAIVRPGPIQGQMVHPYLRRRNGEEAVSYPDATVERILKKTLGVPLFQEQAMRLAILCAGFTPDEADQLRRAIAAWKSKQKVIYEFGQRIVSGMIARGYDEAFAQRCFQQIQGFSEYGFPESHAASFALIVYVSAWLKVHHPAAFAAALLNSQPMGFYAPAQIVRDAQEHGVPVRRVDVNHSDWDCTLEFSASAPSPFQGEGWGEGGASDVCMTPSCGESLPNPSRSQSPAPPLTQTLPEGERGRSAHPCQREPALRLGMRQVRGLREDEAKKIVAAVREHGAFHDVMSLWRASGVRVPTLRALARADAFASMGLDRQQALWQVRALRDADTPLLDRLAAPPPTPPAPLPPIAPRIKVHHDYAATGLSLKAHPVSFLRPELDGLRVTRNGELKDESRWPNGRRIAVAGVVLVRQRPGTASGIVFMTLEDETGIANLIVRPRVFERYRKAARHGVFVVAKGSVERQGQVVHVMVRAIHEVSDLAAAPGVHRSRDFH